MKTHYEKCVKQPRSSEPQPSTACEPQQDVVCDPTPVTVSQPTPAQQAKRPAALQFSSDPPPAKKRQLTSTVMWCGLQQLPKMTWMTRLLSSCISVACHSASLNIPFSSPSSRLSATFQTCNEQQTSRQVQ